MKKVKKVVRWIMRDWWVVRRCLWPYPPGYGIYNKRKNTILDTGITEERARALCEELNNR